MEIKFILLILDVDNERRLGFWESGREKHERLREREGVVERLERICEKILKVSEIEREK